MSAESSRRRARWSAVAGALASLLTASAPAWGEASLEGSYTQGPLEESYTVQEWAQACGAAPVSTKRGGGDAVVVKREGDELTFVGGGRVFRSSDCYDPMPTLVRDAHSYDPAARSWRTRCKTRPTDPYRTILQTLVVAMGDRRIDVVETGRYETQLQGGRCLADVKRTRSFFRSGDPAPPPAKPLTPEPPATCATPGPVGRLEVRPSRKIVRPGETFRFRAVAADLEGCPVAEPVVWGFAPSVRGLRVDGTGAVTVDKDAAEGAFDLTATAAGRRARVLVEVAEPGHYEALLLSSGLNDAGESDGPSVAVAVETVSAPEVHAEDAAARRRRVFLAVVIGFAVLLAAVTAALARRSRRARALRRVVEERYEREVNEVLDRRRARDLSLAAGAGAPSESEAPPPPLERLACPVCQREFDAPTRFCPHDASPLRSLSAPPAASPSLECPTCRRSFDASVRRCPHDGDELVPQGVGGTTPMARRRGKICPTCGKRFDGAATFCGVDGTVLVLLN